MSTPPAPVLLVVDDDVLHRLTMGLILRGAGLGVLEADTATLALQKARSGVDLVLLDVHLPDGNGHEVCRRLRADEATKTLPVVLVSGMFVHPEDRCEGLEEGADAYLVKPVEPRELLATVRTLLRVRTAEEAALASARQWQATFDAIGDAVYLLDAAGVIVRGNRAAGALLGRDSAELVGRPWSEALTEGLRLSEPAPVGNPGEGPRTRELTLAGRCFRAAGHPIQGRTGGGPAAFRS
jgi:DNA-binding response OmpR family regulator